MEGRGKVHGLASIARHMNHDLFLTCVAHPTRFALLEGLRREPACVGELVDATGHSQSNVSHHLRQLRECGLVTFEREGKNNRYTIAHPAIESFLAAAHDAAAAVQGACEACA